MPLSITFGSRAQRNPLNDWEWPCAVQWNESHTLYKLLLYRKLVFLKLHVCMYAQGKWSISNGIQSAEGPIYSTLHIAPISQPLDRFDSSLNFAFAWYTRVPNMKLIGPAVFAESWDKVVMQITSLCACESGFWLRFPYASNHNRISFAVTGWSNWTISGFPNFEGRTVCIRLRVSICERPSQRVSV